MIEMPLPFGYSSIEISLMSNFEKEEPNFKSTAHV
jgi:hypothetical protein